VTLPVREIERGKLERKSTGVGGDG